MGLFENSTASRRTAYQNALSTNTISLGNLVELSRAASIPYPLFFAPEAVVTAQIDLKTEKLLRGLTKQQFSLGSRTTVNMNDVGLIVKDLIRKQQLLKECDETLVKNQIVGMLSKTSRSVGDDAAALMEILDLKPDTLSASASKSIALEVLIEHMEAKQILVARSVVNYMPQSLSKIPLSGIAIKDAKVPYVFIAGGSHGEHEEPEGRQIFTLALLAVLVARNIFAPVTNDESNILVAPKREYELVAQILMPEKAMREIDLSDLDAVKAAGSHFKVTPSAIAVRGTLLKLIDRKVGKEFLDELRREYSNREKSKMSAPKAVNAIRKYVGREYSVRMLRALDSGNISPGDFCREVCLNKIRPPQIGEFREAVR